MINEKQEDLVDNLEKVQNPFIKSSYEEYLDIYTFPKESSNKIKFTEENFKDKHYICEQCNSFPLIKIINEKRISLTCQNKNHIEQIEFDEFIKRIENNKHIDIKKYQYCQEPNHEKEELIKVCINCKQNLCSKCIHEENENHKIKTFEELSKETNYIKSILKKYVNEKYNYHKNPKKENQKDQFFTRQDFNSEHLTDSDIGFLANSKDLIFTVIVESKNCPNYIHFQNMRYLNSYFGEKMELEYYSYENESTLDIRLFGEIFVKKNKNNCSLLIDGKIIDLKEFYQIENVDTHLNISLLKENEITDMSYMFYDCDILSSISNNSKWTTDKVTNMSYMFYNCKALVFLPESFSSWKTSNVTDMSYMFYGCQSLPDFSNPKMLDISKWDTNKVIDMSYMFYGCENFDSLYISNWNTSKVESFCYMFGECLGLQSLMNIFEWNTSSATDMSYMFYNCLSLNKFDDGNNDNNYDKWKTSKVINISNMFYGCENLKKIPNFISTWDISNVQYMSYMFGNCKSLESLPEGIINWNTGNVRYMNSIFENCSSLIKLPDITQWDISKLIDINSMIEGCDKLEKIPEFSKWKDKKIAYKEGEKFGNVFK